MLPLNICPQPYNAQNRKRPSEIDLEKFAPPIKRSRSSVTLDANDIDDAIFKNPYLAKYKQINHNLRQFCRQTVEAMNLAKRFARLANSSLWEWRTTSLQEIFYLFKASISYVLSNTNNPKTAPLLQVSILAISLRLHNNGEAEKLVYQMIQVAKSIFPANALDISTYFQSVSMDSYLDLKPNQNPFLVHYDSLYTNSAIHFNGFINYMEPACNLAEIIANLAETRDLQINQVTRKIYAKMRFILSQTENRFTAEFLQSSLLALSIRISKDSTFDNSAGRILGFSLQCHAMGIFNGGHRVNWDQIPDPVWYKILQFTLTKNPYEEEQKIANTLKVLTMVSKRWNQLLSS